jgi:F0F1-type ATP synthase membrane subunit b/b'
MAVHNNRSITLGRDSGERSGGTSPGPIVQRLANFFRGTKDQQAAEPAPTGWVEGEQWPVDDEVLPRFPVVRHGYDCAAVDAHVAELERELAEVDHELAELRAHSASREEVDGEIRRIGEQTSAVLIAANEKCGEMLREAQEEADRCLAEAKASAKAITEEGEARRRELETQHEAIRQERDRLLEDVRTVSSALAALADSGEQPAG